MAHWAFLVPLIPAVSYFGILLIGKRLGERCAYVGISALVVCWVLSLVIAYQWIDNREVVRESITWFDSSGALGGQVRVGTHIDGLSVMMLVVVTSISLLVHVYSLEYLRDDRRFTHYYAALSLFSASMLMLVIADNTLALLTSWELVGLCSFMLISHWWEDKNNSNAGLKAFIVNRVGDVGLIIGVIITFWFAGRTFNIETINRAALSGTAKHSLVLVAACCLMGAVCSKSGQVPLHIWLPDAMAGPTPVSALIHAATMVVAGVYMVARLYGVFFAGFSIGDGGINLMALIGGVTVVLGASLAFVQFDIKRVLAYSTISQLGYMVLALGTGAWTAGVFHLFTHAFFKACLFLCAGSLSHACHHTFDMREMGGLRKKLRITHWTFLLSMLALAGVFPLAGFWSKDEILNGARAGDYKAVMILGFIGAFMTAAYMGRAYFMIFWGDYHGHGEPHESPRLMTVPLVVLAVLSVGIGLVNVPHVERFSQWVKFETEVENQPATVSAAAAVGGPASEGATTAGEGAQATEGEGELTVVHTIEDVKALPPGTEAVFEPEEHEFNWTIAITSTLVALAGLALATWIYGVRKAPKHVLERSAPARALHTLLVNKYYLDALAVDGIAKGVAGPVAVGSYWVNQHVIDGAVNGTGVVTKRYLAPFFYDTVDQWIIDGVYNGSGEAVKEVGGVLRRFQTGRIQRYALWLFASTAILVVVVATVT